jgi:hypothetical protein
MALAAGERAGVGKAMSAVGPSLSAMRTFLARPIRNQVMPSATSSGFRAKRRAGGLRG